MTDFTTDLLAIFRKFGLFERDQICCGTVTVPQCIVLQTLLEGANDINGLAESSGVTASAMTRLVDGLERNDWVTRQRGADDRRRIVVELTPGGEQEARRLRALTEASVNAVLQAIPTDKHAQVTESVRLIREALDRAGRAATKCCG
ncbi:MAG: MarR family winged helix-turn-helix transcriptional regulator [Polyangiaceae bacterium]